MKDNKFYGLTKAGGASDMGVIFEWNPSTNAYVKKIELTTLSGITPLGSLLNVNGVLYGLTSLGVQFDFFSVNI